MGNVTKIIICTWFCHHDYIFQEDACMTSVLLALSTLRAVPIDTQAGHLTKPYVDIADCHQMISK